MEKIVGTIGALVVKLFEVVKPYYKTYILGWPKNK
jgi:hypothetical protein